MCVGAMGVAGQPGVMTNGMMGMAPQMMSSMQVSICLPTVQTVSDLFSWWSVFTMFNHILA